MPKGISVLMSSSLVLEALQGGFVIILKLRAASAWWHLNYNNNSVEQLQRNYKQNEARTRPIRAF